jgi:putative intracellular protease/amidase
VVLVVSAAGRDSGRTHPGYEQDELSQAWVLFTRNGFRVTIASPDGGAVVADAFDADKDYNAAFFADSAAVTQLRATRRTAGMPARDVNAVMVIGGKGAMFDLAADTALARLVGQVYEQGGVVSAVCHGPAGLLRARSRDGRALVAGRAMTGFTNEEEAVFGKQWRAQFAFLLEDEARRLGARWDESPLMMPRVVVDGRLVTGQNPFSTSEATDAVITALGRTPLPREPWRDEASVYAAVRLLAEEPTLARRQLAAMRNTVHIEYIGMLGYYQLVVAEARPDIQRAVTLMELASPYMDAPQITLGLARGYHRLGRVTEARALARSLVSREGAIAADARALLEAMQQ